MCDFCSPDFKRPEMVKYRHCIVVSPKRHTGCCLVVPISTIRPIKIEPYHFQIPRGHYQCIDTKDETDEFWVKGDMVTHAAFSRLDRVKENGRFADRILKPEHLAGTKNAVLAALGFSNGKSGIFSLTTITVVGESTEVPSNGVA